MDRMKYIIIKTKNARLVPIVFNDYFSHKSMFTATIMAEREEARRMGREWQNPTIFSAGFVFPDHMHEPYGKSESLEIGSNHGIDSKVLLGDMIYDR